MVTELKKFGNRKFEVPTDWTPGNLVTWKEGDEERYGMVVELRFAEKQPLGNRRRLAFHFYLDMVSAGGLINFGLSHTIDRGAEHGEWGAWIENRFEPTLPRLVK